MSAIGEGQSGPNFTGEWSLAIFEHHAHGMCYGVMASIIARDVKSY